MERERCWGNRAAAGWEAPSPWTAEAIPSLLPEHSLILRAGGGTRGPSYWQFHTTTSLWARPALNVEKSGMHRTLPHSTPKTLPTFGI